MQWRNINLADSRSEAAKLKHFESGGALAKRGTFVYDQNQTILCRSQAERKFLSLYNVGNGLTESLLLQIWHFISRKKAVHSRNTFFVLKMGHISQEKRALSSLLKKCGGGGGAHAQLTPGSAAPVHDESLHFRFNIFNFAEQQPLHRLQSFTHILFSISFQCIPNFLK